MGCALTSKGGSGVVRLEFGNRGIFIAMDRACTLGSVAGGGRGVAFGRNIWQAPRPSAVVRALGAIIGALTDRPGYCYARDQYGQTVIIECPPGY